MSATFVLVSNESADGRSFADRPSGAVNCILRLEGEPGIASATELRKQLDAALLTSRNVDADAGGLAAVDTAVLQLLVAFRAALEALGCELRWLGASEPLRSAARLLGLEEALKLGADSAR